MEHKKIIWFKKAKCAGSSIESLLQEHKAIYYLTPRSTMEEMKSDEIKVICVRDGIDPYGNPIYRNPDGSYERKASPLSNRLRRLLNIYVEPREILLDKFPQLPEKYYKFSIVRNPYDKFISSWKYLKSTKNMDIMTVLNNLPKRKYFHDWLHITKTQTECLYQDNYLLVDQIIYMERDFQKDINNILASIGLPADQLPEKNVNERKHYLEYLTPEAIDAIRKIYRDDFINFGYSFDPEISAPISKATGDDGATRKQAKESGLSTGKQLKRRASPTP